MLQHTGVRSSLSSMRLNSFKTQQTGSLKLILRNKFTPDSIFKTYFLTLGENVSLLAKFYLFSSHILFAKHAVKQQIKAYCYLTKWQFIMENRWNSLIHLQFPFSLVGLSHVYYSLFLRVTTVQRTWPFTKWIGALITTQTLRAAQPMTYVLTILRLKSRHVIPRPSGYFHKTQMGVLVCSCAHYTQSIHSEWICQLLWPFDNVLFSHSGSDIT